MNPTTTILSTVIFTVVVFHTFFYVFYHPPTETSTNSSMTTMEFQTSETTTGQDWTLDPACDDGNPCTRDLGLQGQCRYGHAPRTQPCHSDAYRTNASLHCESGLCIGRPQDCKALDCETDMDCGSLFTLSNRTQTLGDYQFEPVLHETHCIRHQCLSHLILTVVTSMRQTEDWWSTSTGPHLAQGMLPCEEFLVQKNMQTEFFLLDLNLVNYSIPVISQWGLPNYPIQLGLCTFQWSCARDYVYEPSPSPVE